MVHRSHVVLNHEKFKHCVSKRSHFLTASTDFDGSGVVRMARPIPTDKVYILILVHTSSDKKIHVTPICCLMPGNNKLQWLTVTTGEIN